MRRCAIVGPLWAFGVLLALPLPVQAQTADTPPAVSIERIRAALQQPPSRLLAASPGDTPTFRLEVRQLFIVSPPPEEKPFDPTFGLPSIGELVMGGIGKIQSTAVKYKRGRAERHARKQVDDELAAFCATRECLTSPATRDVKQSAP
jgi:hypothetical protein